LLTTIDRYILRQVAVPLASALAIGLLMLLAERLVRLLDITLGKRNSFGVVFELLAYLVPHYLGTAVPAALFLGLLFGFNNLSRNNEIDAFLAAGAGLHKLLKPALLLALIFSMGSLAIFGWFQPMTRYAYRSAIFDIKNVDAFYLAEEGVFMQAGNRTFILDKLDRRSNTFERIFIFDYNGPNGSETFTAERGLLIPLKNQPRPVLRLENGRRLGVERWPLLESSGAPVPAETASFESTDTPLGRISKKLSRPRGEDERELTLPELFAQADNPPSGTTSDAMWAEFHRRIINIVAMLLLPVLAIPFAIGRARSPRAYRMIVAMALLIGFHEVIEQGAVMAKAGTLSPWLVLWLPMLLLTAFALWRFYRASFTITHEGMDPFFASIHEAAARLVRKMFPRLLPGTGGKP
jgi:lipopolysaccharide export system permease protein